MVLAHRSGVIGPRTRLHWADDADWDEVCATLAAAEPWWQPGTAQGYHMVTFGFILGEVVRRVTGRTIGQYLRTEIAEPLGIDVHIGLPRPSTTGAPRWSTSRTSAMCWPPVRRQGIRRR